MQNAKRKVTGDIMKRITILILCFILCLAPCLAVDGETNQTVQTTVQTTVEPTTEVSVTAQQSTEPVTEKEETTIQKAEPTTEKNVIEKENFEVPEIKEEPVDNSQPRLMVTGYEIEDGFISPEETKKLTITLKNMHSSKAVSNIKLTLSEDTDEIRPTGMGTKYVSSIGAGKYYSWIVELKAIHTATVGEHKLSFSCEYEDENGSGYGASDILRLEVRQPAELVFDGAKLPVKVVQDETVTLNINLMNTGKTALYNCKVDFNIEGLDSGGSSYVGEIQPQQSATASANLLVDSEKIGEVKGTITVTYEDTFGKEYTLTHDVKTIIEKKVVKAQKQEEEEKKNPLWWLFLLGGLVVGGGLGFGIPFAIKSKKQREEDEKRL